MDEEGNPVVVRGIPKAISMRQISTMQLKKFCRKGCQLYASHIEEAAKNENTRLEDYPVLQDFEDVFPDEVPRLPPKRDIDLTIEIVPGAAPMSSAPYRMTTPEMLDLKMQLQELLDKKYIRSSVSPWGTSFVCKEEIWYTQVVY